MVRQNFLWGYLSLSSSIPSKAADPSIALLCPPEALTVIDSYLMTGPL